MADEKDGTTTTPEAPKSAWETRVGEFAAAVGKNLDDVNAALKPIVGDPSDAALELLSDERNAPESALKAALSSIPLAVLNKHFHVLRGVPAVKAESSLEEGTTADMTFTVLPPVPDTEKFLELLKTTGILKPSETDVLAAVKAALADTIGLYNLPGELITKMERFAEGLAEPVGDEFYTLQRLLTEKRYGDLFTALKVPGRFMTEGRKTAILGKIRETLWPSLFEFQTRLSAWQDSWLKGMSPNIAFMMMATKDGSTELPPGLMNPPTTAPLRGAGEEVIEKINGIFAGAGIPAARAVAYDATRIMEVLNNPALPAQLGAASKEHMLRELKINVGSDLVLLEKGLTQYAMAIMFLPKVPPVKKKELAYFSELYQLGQELPWGKLVGTTAGIGKKVTL